MKTFKELETGFTDLKKMCALQCLPGTYDWNPYSHGMANGMIYAVYLFEGGYPQYLNKPTKWLAERSEAMDLSVVLNSLRSLTTTQEETTMELSLNDLRELFGAPAPAPAVKQVHPYQTGEPYFIRTVTHIYTGRLTCVYPQELVLTDCAWIADTGRFADSLKDLSKLQEVEPFPDGEVVIGRGAILDAHVTTSTPREQK